MSYKTKFVAALIALLAMAVIASRQLFLSVATIDSTGLSTVVGGSHIWFALGAGIAAFVAGVLMFRFFGLHEKLKWAKARLIPAGPILAAIGSNGTNNLPAPVSFESAHWAVGNTWLSEGQPDDRIPMDGSVKESGDTSSGQRSFARRRHQLMFKKWSRTRHD